MESAGGAPEAFTRLTQPANQASQPARPTNQPNEPRFGQLTDLSMSATSLYMCICVSLVDYRVEIAGFNKIINVRLLVIVVLLLFFFILYNWNFDSGLQPRKPKLRPQITFRDMLLFNCCLFNVLQIKYQQQH